MTRLATIGYQGAYLADLAAALKAAGVSVLVDVRAAAWSRRPEFTARALGPALEDAGIAYRHRPALGNPFRKLKPGGDFAHAFAAHLEGREARAALAEVAGLMAAGLPCLMCMERDPAQCHRALVAEKLAALTGCAVTHLTVPRPGKGADQLSLEI